MKDAKLQTKMIFNVPIPESDFPDWDFIIKKPLEKTDNINIQSVKKKKYGNKRNTDTNLF